MDVSSTTAKIEQRIVRDMFVGVGAILFLACIAYLLDLLGALAEWTGRPEIKEVDTVVVVLMFSVWLVGIFLLRRLYELRHLVAERTAIVERVYESEKMESLARMAGGLAHDFNNLLMAMLGFCSIALKRPDAGDQVKRDIMEIKGAGDKATSLVERLLTFTRKKTPEMKLLDLNENISNMEPLFQHLVGNEIILKTDLDVDLHRIRANITHIEEILVNLTLNAHDAMREGDEVTIRTTNVRVEEDAGEKLSLSSGNYVKLSVSDTGSGIDPKIVERIFSPFFSTKEKGTGLGLSMVAGIVKQYGGNVNVDSELGKGSTFNIFLPCVDEAADEAADAQPEAA